MLFHKLTIYFGTGIILLAFFVALYFSKVKKPKYFNWVFVFICLGLLLSVNSIFVIQFKFILFNYTSSSFGIQRFLVFLQVVAISVIYYSCINRRYKKHYSLLMILVTLSTSIFIWYLIEIKLISHYYFYLTVSSTLIAFSFLYFRDILISVPKVNLFTNPIFWIFTGIFIMGCISFPIMCLIKFIPRYIYSDINLSLFALNNIALILLYLFVIKAYLCLKHQTHNI